MMTARELVDELTRCGFTVQVLVKGHNVQFTLKEAIDISDRLTNKVQITLVSTGITIDNQPWRKAPQ